MAHTQPRPLIQYPIQFLLGLYVRAYHRLEVDLPPTLPKQGPVLALSSHFSLLDTIASMVADPYRPLSTVVVKDSLMRVPLVGTVLRAWGAIPVARQGRDISALRSILRLLREGRTMAIAPEGTRSRTGRLGPMHPVLMRLVVEIAGQGVPIIPFVQLGTFEALPPGAWVPRPRKIRIVAGDPLDLSRWRGKRISDEDLVEVAALVQGTLAAMLPPERRPAPGTPPLRGRPGPVAAGPR